jgi:hypothetical protein
VQTERVTEGLAALFVGGVRGLETKWRLGSKVDGADLAWAAVDVSVISTSVKLVKAARMGRAVTPATNTGIAVTRAGGFSEGETLFGSRVLAHSGRMGVAVARFGATPAAVYLMFRYPQLINATLAELGDRLGVGPWVVKFLFWFVTLSVTLRLALFLLGPLSWVLRGLGWLTGVLAAWYRSARMHRRLDPRVV